MKDGMWHKDKQKKYMETEIEQKRNIIITMTDLSLVFDLVNISLNYVFGAGTSKWA